MKSLNLNYQKDISQTSFPRDRRQTIVNTRARSSNSSAEIKVKGQRIYNNMHLQMEMQMHACIMYLETISWSITAAGHLNCCTLTMACQL